MSTDKLAAERAALVDRLRAGAKQVRAAPSFLFNEQGMADLMELAAAALEAAKAAPAEPVADAQDAQRWRTFIGLPYEIRAEWAVNLSLAPVLTSWIDKATKEQTP